MLRVARGREAFRGAVTVWLTMTMFWIVVRGAAVIILLGQNFCVWPPKASIVSMPVSTQFVDMAVTLCVPMRSTVTPPWSVVRVIFWGARSLRRFGVWAGRLSCFSPCFRSDNSFPSHLCHLPYLLHWGVTFMRHTYNVSAYTRMEVLQEQGLEDGVFF